MLALPYYPNNSKDYNRIYHAVNKKIRNEKNKLWRINNPEKEKLRSKLYLQNKPEVRKNYYKNNLQFYKSYNKLGFQKIRFKALEMIDSKLKCVRCGCDDTNFLEINHKNADGFRESKGHNLAQRIVKGLRKVDDLEILCRPCNHIHYLEKKYGKETGLSVIYKKPV